MIRLDQSELQQLSADMGARRLLLILSGLGAVYLAWQVHTRLGEVVPVPDLPRDAWWGAGERRKMDESIRAFKIDVKEEVITDLHSSLDRFLKRRVTPPLEKQGFQYGFNTDYLRTVLLHWRNKYQWKKRQDYLNQFPQFKTFVNGLELHWIRVTPQKAAGKKVVPLLLLHGWPGSVREFYEMIPLLTTPREDREFVFDVVAPSLPGYGFSQGAARPGLGVTQISVLMRNLMERLGFKKFFVQGGDWGSLVATNMGILYPENVLGVHLNGCAGDMSLRTTLLEFFGSYYPPLVVEEKFQHLMYPRSNFYMNLLEEMGYAHLQATKPDTIGTALSDTPAGLATYILEKFSTWTNPTWKSLPDGGLTKRYSLDSLLDNIMIYWITGSITTTQRLYAETMNKAHFGLGMENMPVKVPSACQRYHHDIMWIPETLLRHKYQNLLQLTDHEDGGHFAAFEHPKDLAEDVWSAVAKFLEYNASKPAL